MPTTRKKVIKTVYKDEDDSAGETGDFSDSGSDAKISEEESSSEEEVENEDVASSGDEFVKSKKQPTKKVQPKIPKKFVKTLINRISQQSTAASENENNDVSPAPFSVKDLTDADKLLPPILNLSESDSSDDESPKQSSKNNTAKSIFSDNDHNSEDEVKTEYKDVWSHNKEVDSEEVARKAFLELEKHKSKIEETKASVNKYTVKQQKENEFNVQDLLAQGEEIISPSKTPVKKKSRNKKVKDESDSDVDDWEEVQENKAIPQQGLQLVVQLPDSVCRKTKKIDVEMMMKRKINRVKKEYQVYMHKVHVLCWLGHGNHVSQVLNDQEVLAATLALVPSKECYPGERVDMKYLEQITTWFKDKLTLKQDKNENKFRPKAPPLKEILLAQLKSRVVTTKKYLVFIFVAMLRALGLQCRVMFNFVTLPIKPPSSELCSLSTKPKEDVNKEKSKEAKKAVESNKASTSNTKKSKVKPKSQEKISQVDGNYDREDDESFDNIMQVDGNDDALPKETRNTRARKEKTATKNATEEDVSPPKKSRNTPSPKPKKTMSKTSKDLQSKSETGENSKDTKHSNDPPATKSRRTRNSVKSSTNSEKVAKVESQKKDTKVKSKVEPPKIVVTKANQDKEQSSKYFSSESLNDNKTRLSRKRALTANPDSSQTVKDKPNKSRTKSAPGNAVEKSKYFDSETESTSAQSKKSRLSLKNKKELDPKAEDERRISHRDLVKKTTKPKNDVKGDLINLIKGRVKEAKEESKKGKVKGKSKPETDDDSDFLPEEDVCGKSESDDEFKPSTKISPRPSTSKKIDRRVISSSESDTPVNKIDVWCEVFVEELEQWISVNVIKATVHCAGTLYTGATHPVCYVVGWDNNNYLKDLTRRYVPHWNTVTRKQRAEPLWWNTAVKPWLAPSNPRDREENEQLDRMQLEAPLPKSIAEYKNHPLYALKRHLLKFEAIYPPDAATLGFVRGEPVYARECVYTCRSRDTWLKEAKVVRLGEEPYKVVKARPKWDKLSNKLITDKPLEVFGPWQVQDYEPPTAEGGIVPRNAYGNVELFKACMLPKGTVHIKLPGLNRIAKKLNIDCAPAMTGFDFNGGWSHPVYDGFVVCEEFGDLIQEAWVADQEDLERKEQEKTEARVYGNWRRLIKGLLIRERLKNKYGFQEPSTSNDGKKNTKGPRLVVKKK
ncbi:DNA repair protein complementing XP-C cells homolog [Ostrinia nubilalis]|uniref:DNA repair protein complementing XP-C cells homolog n=1 Tax=Ostrinia nubilalis TaxID=29057 RepID=UPI0030824813